MMQALHEAIALNNEATAMLLKSPDHEEVAVGTLTESLKQLKKILVSLPPPPSSPSYKTKAALFYRQQLDLHVGRVLQSLPYRGREHSRGLKNHQQRPLSKANSTI